MDASIDNAFIGYTLTWIIISTLVLLFYDLLLQFSREVEYIWFKPFSPPGILYIFARYGFLIARGFRFSLNYVTIGRSCNMLVITSLTFDTVAFIGVQGLLVARAYSICRGSKILTIALFLGLLACISTRLYATIAFSECLVMVTATTKLIELIADVCVVYTDIIVFGIILWKVWGTWKLKREAGIHNYHSLVSVLLSQSFSRFCFVILFTVTVVVVASSVPSDNKPNIFLLVQGLQSFQNALSCILVANFTLDLRQLNAAKIEASNLSLPTLHFSNVLQHVHQSIVVELAEPERQVTDDIEHDINVELVQD